MRFFIELPCCKRRAAGPRSEARPLIKRDLGNQFAGEVARNPLAARRFVHYLHRRLGFCAAN